MNPDFRELTKELSEEVGRTISFLGSMADQLDQWAIQSRSGGWSTHQVEANMRAADDCRRQAANLASAFRKA